jgi:hypothetical protein
MARIHLKALDERLDALGHQRCSGIRLVKVHGAISAPGPAFGT